MEMYCLQIVLPETRSVHYRGQGQFQDVVDADRPDVEDSLITVYSKGGCTERILLSSTGELFGFDYVARLSFLHASDLRNMPYWGIDLESSVETAGDQVGEMLDRGHICHSICIRYIGVHAESGIDVGYGVFAEKDIEKGSFIGEYVGVVFQSSSTSSSCYALNYPCKTGGYVVDSNDTGNIIRMVNHSENHNCNFQNIFHDSLMHAICVSIICFCNQSTSIVLTCTCKV